MAIKTAAVALCNSDDEQISDTGDLGCREQCGSFGLEATREKPDAKPDRASLLSRTVRTSFALKRTKTTHFVVPVVPWSIARITGLSVGVIGGLRSAGSCRRW